MELSLPWVAAPARLDAGRGSALVSPRYPGIGCDLGGAASCGTLPLLDPAHVNHVPCHGCRTLMEDAVGQLLDYACSHQWSWKYQREVLLKMDSRDALQSLAEPVRNFAVELLQPWLKLLEAQLGDGGGIRDSCCDSGGGAGEMVQPRRASNLLHRVLSLLIACCGMLGSLPEEGFGFQCLTVLPPWLARHGKGAARACSSEHASNSWEPPALGRSMGWVYLPGAQAAVHQHEACRHLGQAAVLAGGIWSAANAFPRCRRRAAPSGCGAGHAHPLFQGTGHRRGRSSCWRTARLRHLSFRACSTAAAAWSQGASMHLRYMPR